jgi:pentatricopeptide repeat protein
MLSPRHLHKPWNITDILRFSYGINMFVGYQLRACRVIGFNATADFTEYRSNEQVQDQAGANAGDDIIRLCMKGRLKEALGVLNCMYHLGISADSAAYAHLLLECGNVKSLSDGKMVHFHMIKAGFEPDVFVGNNLINMYAKCGVLEDARHLFDKMCERSVVTWNALIAGYILNGDFVEALKVFCKMKEVGVPQTSYTFTSVLKACTGLEGLEMGQQVHGVIVKSGLQLNVFEGSALVDMYVKCGNMEDARQVFDEISERNVVMYTALIAGYVQHGQGREALQLFEEMSEDRVSANQFTFASVLNGCASEESLEQGKQVHAKLIIAEFEPDFFVVSALIDMYAKCGDLEDAHKVFDKINESNEVLWTALITGYAQHGLGKEALLLFEEMQWSGMKPNDFTFANVLRACASLAALARGRQAHAHLIKSGFEEKIFPGSTLVDMYAKCGSIEDAQEVFERMPKRNVVSWNAMITGCAQHGLGKEALKLFEKMQLAGTKPDVITFVGILSACSHAGLVDEGKKYFNSMAYYGIETRLEHCVCMVDLFGRAGLLGKAEHFIKNMVLQPDALIWRTLLGACRVHGNIELGKRAAKCLLELEPHNAATYVLLSNMYASVGRWDDRAIVRDTMEKRRVKKDPGCSWINIQNKVHTFIIGDRSHLQTDEIYENLESLTKQMKEARYVPDTNSVLHDIKEE